MMSVPFVVNPSGNVIARIGLLGDSTPVVTFFKASDVRDSVTLKIDRELTEGLRAISESNYPMTVGTSKGLGSRIVSTDSEVYLDIPGRFTKQLFLVRTPILDSYHAKKHVITTLIKNLEQALEITDCSKLATLEFSSPVPDSRCFNIIVPDHPTTLRFGIGRHRITTPRNALSQYELLANNDVYMMSLYHPSVKHAEDSANDFKAKIEGYKQLLAGEPVAWLDKEAPLRFIATRTRRIYVSKNGEERVLDHEYKLLSVYEQQFGVAFQMLYTDKILKDIVVRMEEMYNNWLEIKAEFESENK